MQSEKENLSLQNTAEPLLNNGRKRARGSAYPDRKDPIWHGEAIAHRLQECAAEDLGRRRSAAIQYRKGVYLEFSGLPGYKLKIMGLENPRQGIYLLNSKSDPNTRIATATVYIPEGGEAYYLKKVQGYIETAGGERKPRNDDLIRSIEDVSLAAPESFWIGDLSDLPKDEAVWCEIWLRTDPRESNAADVESNFEECCAELGIECRKQGITFPLRTVKLCSVNRDALTRLIDRCDYLAEIRGAAVHVHF